MTDVDQASAPSGDPTPRGMLSETWHSLRAVFANRNLRRIELAYAGSAVGDWAYATAIAVWAYGEGGAKAVGIWMAIRYTLMALSAPFSSTLADRMSRKRLMVIADAARALLVLAAALCLFLDTPAAPVYVLATVTSLFGTPFMVAQRSMLPSLADRPEELSAANGAASTIESLAFFVGPAIGALMLGFTTVQVVFLVNVATFIWSMAMVIGVRPPVHAAPDGVGGDESDDDEQDEGFFAETSAGFRTIAADRSLLVATVATCAQTFVAGASAVFAVVMAAELLGTGPRGVGFLDSVFGIGSIVGGAYAISRASKGRLGTDLAAGVMLWSLPLVLVTIWPTPAACFAAMVLLGLGNPLVDVNLDTIVQRLTPDAVLGRVFGALEACFIATMALGALVMPFLIDWLGLRLALLAVAVPVALAVVLGFKEMRSLDARLLRPDNLDLLAAVDIFAPLTGSALESLAQGAVRRTVIAGEVLVREGEESDRFFVVETGLVEVTQAGRVLRREGVGEYFGEIGLLRDVPRTATVTAVADTVVQEIEREDFLRAVSGHREARLTAENIVTRRLAL